MRRSDSYRATWLPEDDGLLEYDEAMQRLLFAAALALASCSPPPYPKQYKSFEGKRVTVVFRSGEKVEGILTEDGTVLGLAELGDTGRMIFDEAYREEVLSRPLRTKTSVIAWDQVLVVEMRNPPAPPKAP